MTEPILMYGCVCGKTMTLYPGQVLDCCREAGITRVPLQELRQAFDRTVRRFVFVMALTAFTFFCGGLVVGGILWR